MVFFSWFVVVHEDTAELAVETGDLVPEIVASSLAFVVVGEHATVVGTSEGGHFGVFLLVSFFSLKLGQNEVTFFCFRQ